MWTEFSVFLYHQVLPLVSGRSVVSFTCLDVLLVASRRDSVLLLCKRWTVQKFIIIFRCFAKNEGGGGGAVLKNKRIQVVSGHLITLHWTSSSGTSKSQGRKRKDRHRRENWNYIITSSSWRCNYIWIFWGGSSRVSAAEQLRAQN